MGPMGYGSPWDPWATGVQGTHGLRESIGPTGYGSPLDPWVMGVHGTHGLQESMEPMDPQGSGGAY